MKNLEKMGIFVLIIAVFLMLLLVGAGIEILLLTFLILLVGGYLLFRGKGATMNSGGGVLLTLAGNQKWFVILVMFIAILVIAGILSLTWGIFGLIGLFLLIASMYILFMQRANVAITLRNPFTIIFGLSLVFLILSFLGVDSMYVVDLSCIPGMAELNQLAHGGL